MIVKMGSDTARKASAPLTFRLKVSVLLRTDIHKTALFLLTRAAGAATIRSGGCAHFRHANGFFSGHSVNVNVGDLDIVQRQIGKVLHLKFLFLSSRVIDS